MRRAAVVVAVGLSVLLASCGLLSDKNKPEPKELVPVKPTKIGRAHV